MEIFCMHKVIQLFMIKSSINKYVSNDLIFIIYYQEAYKKCTIS